MLVAIAVVGNDPILRRCVKGIEKRQPGVVCSGHYATTEEAIRELSRTTPSVVLVDVNLVSLGNHDCIRSLAEASPDTRVLMLAMNEEHESTFQSLAAGASGYLLKPLRPAQLLATIRDATAGGAPMGQSIARRVIQEFERTSPADSHPGRLTPREHEILVDLANGLLYKEIAARLGLSYRTVHTHIERIYKKLHVHSRAQAAAKYLKG